ncbi:hypothetical protein LQF12_11660 [Ruania suaedae]|uniref:hypothetical protein n=1 Tax=Ruania suaedae TaxID=2897774 RepID=UPI001E613227|nr:hypothetical protein [Ruania suaedae]UFU02162.1 hypothetical protein LQF12_11660 [Ruania suaedae]
MQRAPLPPDLAARPFLVREARRRGVGQSRLYDSGLYRPTHGVRTVREPASVVELARATAHALPDDAAFSGVTAAEIHQLRLPVRPELTDDLEVMRETDRARVRRRGCAHQKGLELREVVVVAGVRVTGLVDTWCDLASRMSIIDLVVLGDSIANRLGSLDPLLERVSRRRAREIGRVRRAARWVRVGSRSHMESRVRLAVAWARLPDPELNVALDDVIGGWIGEGDLVWQDRRVVVEYQGKDHFTPDRGPADITRRAAAEANGWTYIEIVAADYYNSARRHQFLTRLGHALGCRVDTDDSYRER